MVGAISNDEIMKYFLYTLENCKLSLLDEDDDDIIEYCIFEEFDSGIITFFHTINLQKLYDAGYITDEILEKSSKLRDMVMKLQNTEKWSVESVRRSPDWRNILELSDLIRTLVS